MRPKRGAPPVLYDVTLRYIAFIVTLILLLQVATLFRH